MGVPVGVGGWDKAVSGGRRSGGVDMSGPLDPLDAEEGESSVSGRLQSSELGK